MLVPKSRVGVYACSGRREKGGLSGGTEAAIASFEESMVILSSRYSPDREAAIPMLSYEVAADLVWSSIE
jgi:hypothetical protein